MNTSDISGPDPVLRRKGKPGTPMATPPLTPLIDVFLFLIIFFLLGCKFMQFEGAIPANLPRTVVGDGDEAMPVPLDPIRVDLTSAIDGTVQIRLGGIARPQELADMAGLYRALSEFRSRFGIGGEQEARPVFIHPAAGVRWGAVSDAFNQAVRAGFREVGLTPSGAV